MERTPAESVTRAITDVRNGDTSGIERIVPVLYAELKRIAARQLRGERRDHTLAATALVHEAYLRLIQQDAQDWENRAHFLAIAARVIRRVLVDHARARAAHKRGGERERVEQPSTVAIEDRAVDLLALDDALAKLEALDARQVRVIELRFFGGLSVEEAARSLDVSPATIKRDWELARAFLYRELGPA